MFTRRKTYIIQLELLAVTVGLTLFSESLKGATAKFFVDNRSVLGCLRKGRSKVEDLNNLVLLTVDRATDVRLCLFPGFHQRTTSLTRLRGARCFQTSFTSIAIRLLKQ